MTQEPESTTEVVDKAICEVKSKLKLGDLWVKGDFIWVPKQVSDLKEIYDRKKNSKRKDNLLEVRCPQCHGPIRLAFQDDKKGHDSKADHFEHLGKSAGTTDRKTCCLGEQFLGGEHKMSIRPVE